MTRHQAPKTAPSPGPDQELGQRERSTCSSPESSLSFSGPRPSQSTAHSLGDKMPQNRVLETRAKEESGAKATPTPSLHQNKSRPLATPSAPATSIPSLLAMLTPTLLVSLKPALDNCAGPTGTKTALLAPETPPWPHLPHSDPSHYL